MRMASDDPASILEAQHDKVDRLLGELEKSDDIGGDVSKVLDELMVLTDMEAQVLYPALDNEDVPSGEKLAMEGTRKHEKTVDLFAKLDESADKKDVAALAKAVRERRKFDLEKALPALEKNVDESTLRGIAKGMAVHQRG